LTSQINFLLTEKLFFLVTIINNEVSPDFTDVSGIRYIHVLSIYK